MGHLAAQPTSPTAAVGEPLLPANSQPSLDTGVWAAALPSLQVAASRQATSVSPWTGRVGVGVGCFIHFEAMILDEFEFKF